MPCPPRSLWRTAGAIACLALGLVTSRLPAQIPQVPPGQQLPTPGQAREALQNQPQLVERLRQRLLESGLTPDQVRSRLRAAGYPENLLDDYMMGADTTRRVRPTQGTLDAVRSLGILSEGESDSLRVQDSTLAVSDSLQQVLDSLRFVQADSARADSLADSLKVIEGKGLKLFGIETFRRTSTRFQPVQSGPVDEHYRLGSGDVLVLILTGDVEESYTLSVTREGFVVIPQVGQVYVANLTMGQVEDLLYSRLRRVYSGVRRAPNATTKFQISLAKLRNIQVFVIGDVVRPGAYQISAAGTVLTALYAAGGPSSNGSFRKVEVRRGDKLVASIDVYDYLLHCINASDTRLESGDVVFVPVHSGFVKVAGEVTRPAVYEVLPQETLRDLIEFAGGFGPAAYQTRVRIHRILPPDSRPGGARARVVVDVGPEQMASGSVPGVPMSR
jgi:polysaccharide export outer membrane protein